MYFHFVALKIVSPNACMENWVGWKRTFQQGEFSLHHYYKHKPFDENLLLYSSWCLAVSSITFTLIQLLIIQKERFKLSWLNWVTSYSSWKASKIKAFKTNKWIIIVTDYQTWPAFWPASYNFFDTSTSKFLTSSFLKHSTTKQSYRQY